MIELDELLPEVMRFAPSAPEVTAIAFLRDAAQELCTRTKMWRARESYTVATPECEAIIVQQDAQIIEVEYAALNGRELAPATVGWLDVHEPGWFERYDSESGTARYAVSMEPNTITIVPREAGTLSVRVVLKPSRDADTIPEFLLAYKTELGRAAAGRLLTLPNTEIANPTLGAALWSEWQAALDGLALKEQRSQLRQRPRTLPSFF